MRSRRLVLAGLLLGMGLVGCVETLDHEESRVGTLVRDCVVPLPDGVTGWGAPVSLEYPGESVWIFESVALAAGGEARNVVAVVTSADAVCDGGVDLVTGDDGVPVTVLPLTVEEAEDTGLQEGQRFVLRPTGGFVDGETGYLYYEEGVTGPGVFDFEVVGRGVCVFEDGPQAPCRRLERDGDTRIWQPHERPLNRGGFVDGQHAVVYGCQHVAAFEDLCFVARVLVAEVADPDAYQFHHPFDGWIEDPDNAGVLLKNAGQLTVRWNEYLGAYTATAMDIWESRAVQYRAPDPTGYFDGPQALFDAVKPASFFVGGGIEHASLAQQDGGVIAVSYFTNQVGARFGVHLATFEFAGATR